MLFNIDIFLSLVNFKFNWTLWYSGIKWEKCVKYFCCILKHDSLWENHLCDQSYKVN